ncbi:hypothetical protein FB45DRAFT_1010045 [Roridomyces roridus]|uniref:Uncharacterized protein n=1 Tax=Roridomyces roridus TaxID=1738132 RepID=A0AAD7B571_9AGAR|nr:hypothetical protein FB45DRAFT_1010045 [Roridomyces roridus]
MSLTDCPLDVLLELSKDLDLPDALNLAASSDMHVLCHRLGLPLFLDRVPQAHRTSRPLPCTSGTDIVGLPLDTLRKMAVHAYKLLKNWNSDAPRVVSFRSIELDGGGKIRRLIPIHGEHLFITFSDVRIACWDATTGQCLAVRDCDVGSKSMFPFFLLRKCYVGVASCSGLQLKLATICVNYENAAAIDISTIFSRTWEYTDDASHPQAYCAAVVNERTIGAIIHFNTPNIKPLLAFCRIEDGEIHRLPLDLRVPSWDGLTGLAIGDGFFITTHSSSLVQIVLARPSPTNSNELDAHKTNIGMPGGCGDKYDFLGGHHIRQPTYGVVNVTRADSEDVEFFPEADDANDWRQVHPFCHVNFWLANSATLDMGNIISYRHEKSIHWIAVGSAGRFVVMRDSRGLGLVQYTAQTRGRVRFHRIHVPADMATVSPYWEGELDDKLGTLYLLQNHKAEKSPRLIISSFV